MPRTGRSLECEPIHRSRQATPQVDCRFRQTPGPCRGKRPLCTGACLRILAHAKRRRTRRGAPRRLIHRGRMRQAPRGTGRIMEDSRRRGQEPAASRTGSRGHQADRQAPLGTQEGHRHARPRIRTVLHHARLPKTQGTNPGADRGNAREGMGRRMRKGTRKWAGHRPNGMAGAGIQGHSRLPRRQAQARHR